MDAGKAISQQFATPFYWKSEVKDIMSPNTNQTQNWSKLDDNTLYNQVTWESKKITETQSKAMDLWVWEVWWQCGTYARQITWIQWSINNLIWPTITERKKNFTDKEPVRWWLALFTGW
jgi:hypothetical protein